MKRNTLFMLNALSVLSLLTMVAHIVRNTNVCALVTISRITIPVKIMPALTNDMLDMVFIIPMIIETIVLAVNSKSRIPLVLLPIVCSSLLSWFTKGAILFITCLFAITAFMIIIYHSGLATIFFQDAVLFSILLSSMSIVYWVLYAIFPNYLSSFPSNGPCGLISQLYYVVHPMCAIFIVFFLYSWILIPHLRIVVDSTIVKLRKDIAKIILLLSIITVVLIGTYPYLPTINPSFRSVSVDVYYYTKWINELYAKYSGDIITWAFSVSDGSRPLSLLLFYGLCKILPLSVADSMKIITIGLLCLIPISIYLMTKELYGDVAYIAALMSALSPTVVVGIYAGYQANLLALPISYMAYAFFIKALRKRHTRDIVIASALVTMAMLSHTWTWQMCIVAIAIESLIFAVTRGVNLKRAIMSSLFVILPSIVLDVLRSVITIEPVGMSIGYKVVSNSISLINIKRLGYNLRFLNDIFVGGYTAECMSYILACIGMVVLMPIDILPWVIPASLIFLVSNYTIQSRLLFNMPLAIPVALAIIWLSKKGGIKVTTLLLAVYLLKLSIVLMFMANIVFR